MEISNLKRRDFIKISAFALAGGAAGRPQLRGQTAVPEQESLDAAADSGRKHKVLITGAHPGDPEFACGGIAARYADLGHEVVFVYLTDGQGGIRGRSAEEVGSIRIAEAEAACAVLHVRPVFLGQMDGAAEVNTAREQQYRRVLEEEQPDLVITHWPVDNHPDHRADSTLVYGAWRSLGRRFALYFHEVSNGADTVLFAPTHWVDISAYAGRKREACFAHASQGPERFYEIQERIMRVRGMDAGSEYAEAFVRHPQSPQHGLAEVLPGN